MNAAYLPGPSLTFWTEAVEMIAKEVEEEES